MEFCLLFIVSSISTKNSKNPSSSIFRSKGLKSDNFAKKLVKSKAFTFLTIFVKTAHLAWTHSKKIYILYRKLDVFNQAPFMLVLSPRTWSKFKSTTASPNQTSIWTPTQSAQFHLFWHPKMVHWCHLRNRSQNIFTLTMWSRLKYSVYIYTYLKPNPVTFCPHIRFRSSGCCSACSSVLCSLFSGSW